MKGRRPEEDKKVTEATVDMEIAIKNMQKALAEINNALGCLDNALLCIGYAKEEECK